tara:strand:+ start:386 stop:493 length:108 start_codon:yes stop_codon:yes gene_type:complete
MRKKEARSPPTLKLQWIKKEKGGGGERRAKSRELF